MGNQQPLAWACDVATCQAYISPHEISLAHECSSLDSLVLFLGPRDCIQQGSKLLAGTLHSLSSSSSNNSLHFGCRSSSTSTSTRTSMLHSSSSSMHKPFGKRWAWQAWGWPNLTQLKRSVSHSLQHGSFDTLVWFAVEAILPKTCPAYCAFTANVLNCFQWIQTFLASYMLAQQHSLTCVEQTRGVFHALILCM